MNAVMTLIPAKWRPYAKAVIAIVGSVLTIVATLPTAPAWIPVVITLLTALGVYGVPNEGEEPVGDENPDAYSV